MTAPSAAVPASKSDAFESLEGNFDNTATAVKNEKNLVWKILPSMSFLSKTRYNATILIVKAFPSTSTNSRMVRQKPSGPTNPSPTKSLSSVIPMP